MSVFSVGGNAGFAVGPLFVAAVRVAAGTRGTVFLAVPAVITGVAVYAVLQRSGHAPARGQPVKRQDGAQDDWGGFALLTSTVIVRSIFSFGLSSLLALYVGTSLHGGRQGTGTHDHARGGRRRHRHRAASRKVRPAAGDPRASFAGTALGLLASCSPACRGSSRRSR
jgi:hypothetical protein